MSHDDFCKCTFGEFESICKSWSDMMEGRNRDAWERARTLAAITIQPHIKKKLTPQQLLPMPWDKKKQKPNHKQDATGLTAEEKRKRFEEVARRLGDKIMD